jgi:uncharacterized protein (DUF2252 family)
MSSENVVDPGERMKKCLIATRDLKMTASAHAYVRGSTTRYYEWLEASNGTTLPGGPAVCTCGDCHVGNLGPIASAKGSLAIQIRDLDQTVIGNPAHDIIRLGLSMAMAARGSDLPGVITAHMMECIIDGYEAAFASDAQGETIDASSDMPKPVRTLMRQAAGRSWKHLADERIEGIDPVIPLGKRFWPLTQDEWAAVEALFADAAETREGRVAEPVLG